MCGIQFILLLVLMGYPLTQGRPPVAAPPTATTNGEPFFTSAPGPWGELEYARINIAPPDEFLQAEIGTIGRTQWFFENQTREQILLLLDTLGFTAAQKQLLLPAQSWSTAAEGTTLFPPGELVMHLSPEVRARLYAQLARSPRNDLQVWPYVFRTGGFADWFGHSGLSPTTMALVRQVVYQRGAALCVSDTPELWAQIPDPAERQRLIKTLSRSSSLLMKLRVRPDSDVQALAAYWGRGRHVKDIESLLESLTQIPGGMTVDVAHLLPPFARKRLNSYPAPLRPGERSPDCYWSAWNFFRDPPDDRYFDDALWRQELQTRCQLVAQPTFGDLIFLTRPDGVPIHCAVFVADDVVFTKNGANPRQPWKLMKLEDLLARYPEDYPLQLAIFRPPSDP